MLNRPVKGIGIFRTIFYLPNIIAVTVIGLIWARVFASSDRGLINAFLAEYWGMDPIPISRSSGSGNSRGFVSPRFGGRSVSAC